jgi:DNA-binding CsgD family transcriptional regulator
MLNRVLDEIYASVLDPIAGWGRICDLLASISGSMGTVVIPLRVENRFSVMPVSDAIAPMISDYQKHDWPQRDARNAGIAVFRRKAVFTERDFTTPSEINNGPMYQELLRPHGLALAACVRINTPDGMYAAAIQRHAKNDDYADEELRILEALSPHLSRAATFTFRLGIERARGALDAFERLGIAALALNRNGRVVALNAATRSHLGEWYDVVADRLVAKTPGDNTGLQKLIATVISPLQFSENGSSLDALVRHPTTGKPLLFQGCPFGLKSDDVFSGVAAILVAVDDESHGGTVETLLQNFYGLTRSEARIAMMIADGTGTAAISDKLLISNETARTHIKAIYQKTGDDSRSRLVSRIVALKLRILKNNSGKD